MNPEHWKRLDELFHSALDREPHEREAFITGACEGDDELRAELDSMIAHHEQARSFIESPAYAVAAETIVADDSSETLIGKALGPYQILSVLGAGGMGEVYLAFDTDLRRQVALKFLHTYLTDDTKKVQRFKQEARAASALNHPNILTIFEIGEIDGREFIATEFVEGETLSELINRGTLKPPEVLDVATQIASALSAAHTAGIIHRDIKPENIMVRPDGFIKVLDFGVAKLIETSVSDSDALTLINTEQGMILGTLRYMSPEQARGLVVDSRTDIWSLGVVLYEMVAGQPPFEGATKSDVLAAILEREPLPLASRNAEASEVLQVIVTRALAKDVDERYQTAREVIDDLRRLDIQSDAEGDMEPVAPLKVNAGQAAVKSEKAEVANTGQKPTASATSSAEYIVSEVKRHKKVAVLVFATLAIAVASVAFGFYKFIGRNRSAVHFQKMSMTRLATSGRSRGAAISPDGKYVAYVRDDAGQRSLWLRQVGTTSDIQISPQTDAGELTFSLDGIYLYWSNFFGDLHRMPVLGGPKSLLLKRVNSCIAFSPDGKRFAFFRGDYPSQGESSLLVANVDGTSEQKLASRKQPDSFEGGPAWSPDGKVIACTTGSAYMSVVEVRVESGAQKSMTSQRWNEVKNLAWLSDGSGLLMLASDQGSLSTQVWQLSYPGGESRRITNDFNGYEGLSLAANSRVFVTVLEGQAANIWIASAGEVSRARQVTSRAGKYFGLALTPDGKLVCASEASGNLDIWIIDLRGGDGRQLTVNASANLLPSVSPDGRYVVFTSTRSGAVNIWRMDIDGANPKQLTNGNFDYNSSCSPDGKWVVYVHENSGTPTLWKVSIDGGNPVQLTDKDAGNPVFSPDGKLIACSYGNGKVAIITSEGGQPRKVLDIPTPFIVEPGFQWTSDGRALTYADRRGGVSNIWNQPLDGGPPKQVTDFRSDEIFSFAWSRDGKQLALARGIETGDVVLVSDSR